MAISLAQVKIVKKKSHELGHKIQKYLGHAPHPKMGARYRESHREEYFSWRTELMMINEPLIVSRAREMVKEKGYKNMDEFNSYLEEMLTVSEDGAWRATRDFNPDKGEFSTYHHKITETHRQRYLAFKLRRLGNLPINITNKCGKINDAEGELLEELEREPTTDEIVNHLYRKQVRQYLVKERRKDKSFEGSIQPTEEEIDAVIKRDAKKRRKKDHEVPKQIKDYHIIWLRAARYDVDTEYRNADGKRVSQRVLDRRLDPASQVAYDNQLENLVAIANNGILDWREKKIIKNRFSDNPPTLKALGNELGVTKERVRQIELEALVKLALKQRPELREKLAPPSRALFSLMLGLEDREPMSLGEANRILGMGAGTGEGAYKDGIAVISQYVSSSTEIFRDEKNS